MFEIRINNYDDRCAMVRGLVEAGYTARVVIRQQVEKLRSDAFIIVVSSPELPKYEKDAEQYYKKDGESNG